MKAVVAIVPKQLSILDIPWPVLGDYDVLCEVLASSVCNGTDRNIVFNAPFHNVTFPAVLGHEGIGRVIGLGEKVRCLRIGDIVTRVVNRLPEGSVFQMKYGAMAQYALAVDWQAMLNDGVCEEDVRQHRIHQVLSPHTDPVEACMFITWRETLAYLLSMKPVVGERMLVIGSGANALAFVEHGRNVSLDVCVVGSSKRSGVFVDAGATSFVDYRDLNLRQRIEEQGFFDILIDAVGDCNTTNIAAGCLKVGGRIGVYGLNDVDEYFLRVGEIRRDFIFYNGAIAHDEGAVHSMVVEQHAAGLLDPWRYMSKNHVYGVNTAIEAFHAGWRGDVMKPVVLFKE